METTDPVERQLQAYNARDLEAFLAAYADDCVIVDAAGTPLMQGKEAMRERYGRLFADSPQLHSTLRSRVRVGSHVFDEEHVTGMNLAGMPPELHAMVVHRIDDGLIRSVRLYL
jgi:uncharacterized protein (TIGR02246 family)